MRNIIIVTLLVNTTLYTMDHIEQNERGRTKHRVDRIDLDDMFDIDPEFEKFLNSQPQKTEVPEVHTQQMHTKKHKKYSMGCVPGWNAMRALSMAVQYHFMK